MARVVHTEPYAFLPQTLERGAIVESAPLLASLTRADKPFAQHAVDRLESDAVRVRRDLLVASARIMRRVLYTGPHTTASAW